MIGITVKSAIEHLSGILSWYLTTDLDSISRESIASTINSLEAFLIRYGSDGDLDILLGLVSNINSNLYVARGYATPDVPRPLEYYEKMHAVRRLIQQMKSLPV